MPSVSGNSPSLIVEVDWDGTHLIKKQEIEVNPSTQMWKSNWKTETVSSPGKYPNGTLLCNHKWVQVKAVAGIISAMGTACSSEERVWEAFRFCFSAKWDIELILCVGWTPTNGLIGDESAEFCDSTGGGVNDAGARIVKVRSSDVRFDAWRVKTWNFTMVRPRFFS